VLSSGTCRRVACTYVTSQKTLYKVTTAIISDLKYFISPDMNPGVLEYEACVLSVERRPDYSSVLSRDRVTIDGVRFCNRIY
jgi:hypothetical protein